MKQDKLIEAAKAVVNHWDTPNWKDAKHTRDYIKLLRDAVNEAELSRQAQPTPSQSELAKEKTSMQRYEENIAEFGSDTPLENLRHFLSIALKNGDDWLDVEPFLDAISAQLTKPNSEMKESK